MQVETTREVVETIDRWYNNVDGHPEKKPLVLYAAGYRLIIRDTGENPNLSVTLVEC